MEFKELGNGAWAFIPSTDEEKEYIQYLADQLQGYFNERETLPRF